MSVCLKRFGRTEKHESLLSYCSLESSSRVPFLRQGLEVSCYQPVHSLWIPHQRKRVIDMVLIRMSSDLYNYQHRHSKLAVISG